MPLPGGDLLPSLDLLSGDATSEGAGIMEQFDAAALVWFNAGQHGIDLFINHAMAMDRGFANYERLAYLRYPNIQVGPLSDALIAAGVKPGRWFVAVHAREPGYDNQPSRPTLRDQDPATFLPAIAHIITKLGGQVVRLGNPAMSALPAMDGLVDLSRADANLQCFAISRARFLLAGPSGPSSVAACFHVPVALVNAVDVGPENDRAVYRTIKLATPDGGRLTQAALFEAGYDEESIIQRMAAGERLGVIRIAPEEIIRCSNFVYERTANVKGWREPEPVDPRPRPNVLEWPGSTRMRGMFLPENFR
jgi:putative glycosyltransferase (TIGR04372 family)